VARREGDRKRTPLRDTEERDALHSRCVDDGLEIG
jgi:hypothetical protein